MLRRLSVLAFLLILGASTAGAALLLLRDAEPDMAAAADTFLGTLDEAQRKTATMAFDDPARLKWHFIPLAERKGLQFKNMNEAQRKAALGLLRAFVSKIGYEKAEVIMGLESILRELEKTRVGGPIRDPERYYWTIFGTPGAKGRWGLSVEGHHMSLNFVAVDGQIKSFTPMMFGANPATVHSHSIPGAAAGGTRVLKDEEDLAFAIINGMSPEQQKKAIIADKAPADVRAAGEAQAPQSAPEGIPVAELEKSQKKAILALVATYLAANTPTVAESRLKEIEATEEAHAHFAWAGALKPGIGHYYRIQGKTFLIEFVNVQPDAAGNPANHIHAVFRDLRGDFDVQVK